MFCVNIFLKLTNGGGVGLEQECPGWKILKKIIAGGMSIQDLGVNY